MRQLPFVILLLCSLCAGSVDLSAQGATTTASVTTQAPIYLRPGADVPLRVASVGTGGKGLDPFVRVQPNSEVRDSSSFGVLKLTLRRAGYDWEFLPVAGGSSSDSGTVMCRN